MSLTVEFETRGAVNNFFHLANTYHELSMSLTPRSEMKQTWPSPQKPHGLKQELKQMVQA